MTASDSSSFLGMCRGGWRGWWRGEWMSLGGLGGLEGSWEEEVGKIAMAGSHYCPEEAKSVISVTFLKVSAE